MPLSKPQQEVASSKKRFRVCMSGRRFGKTTLSIRELCKFASKPRQEVWYVSPSYKMSKQIVWRKLKYKLEDLNWIKSTNESELYIDLVNGSRISLKGADNYDSLRGVGIDFLVLDEFADIKPDAFYEVLRPTLADTNGQAMFVGTPKGKGNWSYDLYQMYKEDDEWESFHYTTIEGGFVTEEEVNSARKLLDERTFNQEFNADFITSGNRVWYSFTDDNVMNDVDSMRVWNDLKQSPIYVGMDFNIDPMSAVIFTRHGNTVYAIDEIEIFGSNTDEMIAELNDRYGKNRVWVYPDPASRQRKTSAGGRTDLSILENAGYKVNCPYKHNAIRDGVNAVNSKLCNSNGERTFMISPKCKKLIDALNRHEYKPGTNIPDKTTGFDHLTDAMRYFIDYVFPINKVVDISNQPTRWGHSIA